MNGYRHIPSGPFGRPSTSRACKCKEETQESFELARSEVARPLPPNVRRVASLCHLKALEEQNLHRRQPKKKTKKKRASPSDRHPFVVSVLRSPDVAIAVITLAPACSDPIIIPIAFPFRLGQPDKQAGPICSSRPSGRSTN
jgi:hypothetical protein